MFSSWLERFRDLDREPVPLGLVRTTAAVLCGGVVALAWFGYTMFVGLESRADLLLEQRQEEAVTLTRRALNRDMEGAWSRVLVPINQVVIEEEPPYELIQRTARAFARFPYAESFFSWRLSESEPSDGVAYAFNRADRRPAWAHASNPVDPFPVVVLREPTGLQAVIAALRRSAVPANPFIVLEVEIAGVPYQVVAHLLFSATGPSLSGLVAFTVNLLWIQQEYFGPLLQQVATIGGNQELLSFSISDDEGALVAITPPSQQPVAHGAQRRFELLFVGSSLVSSLSTPQPTVKKWTVQVTPFQDQSSLAPGIGRGVLAVLILVSMSSVVALLFTERLVRASARLASMESEFVSAVTHDLKTPIALIRLVGDTLGSGRHVAPEKIREYARLLSREASRLSRSIENMLTYTRYDRSRKHQDFVPADPWDLVEEALTPFRLRLERLKFEVSVDVPHDLPPVRADRAGMVQAIENVISNAINYSGHARVLTIVGRLQGQFVRLTITDQGVGIDEEDLAYVLERFFRGKNAKQRGSGLGLAIAQRVIRHHGGDIALHSALGKGTEVELMLVTAS